MMVNETCPFGPVASEVSAMRAKDSVLLFVTGWLLLAVLLIPAHGSASMIPSAVALLPVFTDTVVSPGEYGLYAEGNGIDAADNRQSGVSARIAGHSSFTVGKSSSGLTSGTGLPDPGYRTRTAAGRNFSRDDRSLCPEHAATQEMV